MKIENESKQMYLKTIWMLGKSGKKVRNIDIARTLGYSKPSVTNAVRKLISNGMVIADKNNGIILTDAGRTAAEKLISRYMVLNDFLISLGAGKETAEENACRLELLITDELFNIIQKNQLQKGTIKGL